MSGISISITPISNESAGVKLGSMKDIVVLIDEFQQRVVRIRFGIDGDFCEVEVFRQIIFETPGRAVTEMRKNEPKARDSWTAETSVASLS